jgi:hypothetical protein
MTEQPEREALERQERVEERIFAIERIGQHGTMPSYWREALFLSLVADDVAVEQLTRERDEARAEADALGAIVKRAALSAAEPVEEKQV